MVLSYYVALTQFEEFSSKALVGHFTGKVVNGVTLKKWMDLGWKRLIEYMKRFHIILMGWICF